MYLLKDLLAVILKKIKSDEYSLFLLLVMEKNIIEVGILKFKSELSMSGWRRIFKGKRQGAELRKLEKRYLRHYYILAMLCGSKLFNSLVRSKFKYCAIVWSPHNISCIALIQNVLQYIHLRRLIVIYGVLLNTVCKVSFFELRKLANLIFS